MNSNLILIAEDDTDIRELLSDTLESAGFRTIAAKDGNTAARILTVAKPIGLITDVRMPAMNGMELCRMARNNPETSNAAILMISANSHAYDIDAGLEAGADGYLPKPLSPRRLISELRQLIVARHPDVPVPTVD